jgi:5'(3')-deoxyribonucleotidase
MTLPIVLLDVDSVLVESNHWNLEQVNTRFGTNYQFEQIVDWNYRFMNPVHREFLYNECWQSGTLYDKQELSQSTLVTIAKLRRIARVMPCTSPMLGHIRSKYAFLLRYFDANDIILIKDKTVVNGAILVDDRPHNIEAFPGHPIIFDCPWNQGYQGDRVHSFSEIYPMVSDLLSYD